MVYLAWTHLVANKKLDKIFVYDVFIRTVAAITDAHGRIDRVKDIGSMPVRFHPHVDDDLRRKSIGCAHGDVLSGGRTGDTALSEHRETGRSVRPFVAVKHGLLGTADRGCPGQGRRRSGKGFQTIGHPDLIGQANDFPDPDLATDVTRFSRFGRRCGGRLG